MNARKILKYLFLTGLTVLSSRLTASVLGHPDNDVIVRNLRETFKAGIVIPDASSLEGKLDCQAFAAYSDINQAYIELDDWDFTEAIPGTGFFTLSKKSSAGNAYSVQGRYVLNSEGLRMTENVLDKFTVEYGRLDAATGNLIFERLTLNATEGRVESIAEPGLFVEHYMICYKQK